MLGDQFLQGGRKHTTMNAQTFSRPDRSAVEPVFVIIATPIISPDVSFVIAIYFFATIFIRNSMLSETA